MPVAQIIRANRRKYDRNAERFARLFDVELQNFFDPVLGFDLLKFKQFAACPLNTDIHTHVYQVWGSIADYVVRDLQYDA
jgi:hypothetical protein